MTRALSLVVFVALLPACEPPSLSTRDPSNPVYDAQSDFTDKGANAVKRYDLKRAACFHSCAVERSLYNQAARRDYYFSVLTIVGGAVFTGLAAGFGVGASAARGSDAIGDYTRVAAIVGGVGAATVTAAVAARSALDYPASLKKNSENASVQCTRALGAIQAAEDRFRDVNHGLLRDNDALAVEEVQSIADDLARCSDTAPKHDAKDN